MAEALTRVLTGITLALTPDVRHFREGGWKRVLRWNCAPTRNRKGGTGQASTYGCARQCPTRQSVIGHRRFSASSDITAPSATGHPVSVTTPSTESFRGLVKGATRHLALGRFFLDHYCLGPFQNTPRSDTDTLPDNPGLGESRLSRDNLDHANF